MSENDALLKISNIFDPRAEAGKQSSASLLWGMQLFVLINSDVEYE